jgi:hypothetical protein
VLVYGCLQAHLHESDLLSREDIRVRFAPSAATFLSDGRNAGPADDSIVMGGGAGRVDARVSDFLDSLRLFRSKNARKLPSVLSMRSVTVLVPLYDETVTYTARALCSTGRPAASHAAAHGGGRGGGGGRVAAGSSAAGDLSCSLIEFLVQKHRSEFNHFAQRIGTVAGTLHVRPHCRALSH